MLHEEIVELQNLINDCCEDAQTEGNRRRRELLADELESMNALLSKSISNINVNREGNRRRRRGTGDPTMCEGLKGEKGERGPRVGTRTNMQTHHLATKLLFL